jgi:hypothetical protein
MVVQNAFYYDRKRTTNPWLKRPPSWYNNRLARLVLKDLPMLPSLLRQVDDWMDDLCVSFAHDIAAGMNGHAKEHNDNEENEEEEDDDEGIVGPALPGMKGFRQASAAVEEDMRRKAKVLEAQQWHQVVHKSTPTNDV